MDDDQVVPVSPRHSVRLAREYVGLVERAPKQDYVVRTIVHREANGLPLMSAEMVIAGREARESFPLAATYPLHFRKTYAAARLHADPAREFECHTLACAIIRLPPPIGFSAQTYRSCLVPGRPYNRVSPFGGEPEESNLRVAQSLPLASAAGLFHLAEGAFAQLTTLHRAGMAHGDAELHNFVVCPSPLEMILIDFESAIRASEVDPAAFESRCTADLTALLREAVFLQCALGLQEGPLAEAAVREMKRLFKAPDRFLRAIERQSELGD